MDILNVAAIAGTTVAALGGLYLALRKAPVEREGVFISTAEGATRILNSAMLALEKDLERKAATIEHLQGDLKKKQELLDHAVAVHKKKDAVIADQLARIQKLEALEET